MEDADALVRKILLTREADEPDADPGDITIVIQDDMDLVEVVQRGQTIAYGSTLTQALVKAELNIRRGKAADGSELWDSERAWATFEEEQGIIG